MRGSIAAEIAVENPIGSGKTLIKLVTCITFIKNLKGDNKMPDKKPRIDVVLDMHLYKDVQFCELCQE